MVKRYAMVEYPHECCMEHDDTGQYFLHDDYAALEAQVRHLEVYPGRCERLEIENAALRYRLSKLERGK